MQIVLDTRGLYMSVRNGCFIFETGTESRMVHPRRVSSILVVAVCRISSPALILAATNQIPVVVCDPCGRPAARIWSPMFTNTSALRRAQHGFAASQHSLNWANELISLKIKGQTDNLKYLANRKPSLRAEIERSVEAVYELSNRYALQEASDITSGKKQLLYVEAYAAAQYWQIMGKAMPEPFKFSTRTKRTPTDGFNACINYLYGMLRNQVESSVLSIGLDPALGIMHRDGFKMPSLVFDLMEPFRPLMDRLLFVAMMHGEMIDEYFEHKADRFLIAKAGRKKLIEMFIAKLHSRTLHRNSNTTLNNHILTEAKLLANIIRKEHD